MKMSESSQPEPDNKTLVEKPRKQMDITGWTIEQPREIDCVGKDLQYKYKRYNNII